MYSDLDTGLSQQQLAKAIITSRELAEIFIQRYMALHRVGRREATRRLAELNIDIKKLPGKYREPSERQFA